MNKNKLIAVLAVDGYKLGHVQQDCPGTQRKYYTWTPRGNKYLPFVDKVSVFGPLGFIKDWIIDFWNENFFYLDLDDVLDIYREEVSEYLFCSKEEVYTEHIEKLHKLGYLPIKIRAVKEGEIIPLRVPCMTVENTHDEFAWVAGYLEDIISSGLWQSSTVASIARKYYQLFCKYSMETVGNIDFCKFQGHDFSYRGLTDPLNSPMISGAAWLNYFLGTDLVPARWYLKTRYNADSKDGIIGCSVPASEHSVAETYMEFDNNGNLIPGWEDEYIRHLIQDVYPKGIVSIVSDTINLWELITEKLVNLKDIIMSRDGKVVIRPDSGNPADILCGYKYYDADKDGEIDDFDLYDEGYKAIKENGKYYVLKSKYDLYGFESMERTKEISEAEIKGVIELLWDIFGGTINEKGYKELDPHIGAIYGDSITLELAEEICERLKAKGFASINWVAGVGSYSLLGQLSRDSLGWALKETAITKNGKEIAVFKDPITDDGTKKSQRGRVVVIKDPVTEEIHYIDGLNSKEQEEMADVDLLELVFVDGMLLRDESLFDIRARVK